MAASLRACSAGKNLSSAAQASSAGLVKAASSEAIWFMKSSPRGGGEPPEVAPHALVGEVGGNPLVDQVVRQVAVGQPAVRGRQGTGRPGFEQGEQRGERPGARGGDERAERLRREVVERAAGGHDQSAEPPGWAPRRSCGRQE